MRKQKKAVPAVDLPTGPAETVKWANDPESLDKVRALFPGVQVEANKYGEIAISTAREVVLAHTGDRIGRRISGEIYIIKRKE